MSSKRVWVDIFNRLGGVRFTKSEGHKKTRLLILRLISREGLHLGVSKKISLFYSRDKLQYRNEAELSRSKFVSFKPQNWIIQKFRNNNPCWAKFGNFQDNGVILKIGCTKHLKNTTIAAVRRNFWAVNFADVKFIRDLKILFYNKY